MPLRKNRIPRSFTRSHMILEDVSRQKSRSFWFYFIWTTILLSLLGSAILASQAANAQVIRTPNDAESGQLLFKDETKGYSQAVHLDTDIDVEISGMISHVKYRQRFRNDSANWQEAVYVFPLSENAAVNHMEMIIGERRILSKIKEREEAKRIYTEAKNAGKRAALTEQQRPNLFTQHVANIAPGEEISVEIHFVQRLTFEHGTFEFHLPTTLTPRYIPGTSTASIDEEKQFRAEGLGWALPTDQVPDANNITPLMRTATSDKIVNPMRLSIKLNAGLALADISSAYHQISQTKVREEYQIALAQGSESMDRDFRLSWRPMPSSAPEAAVFSEQIDGKNYLLLMLVPPQVQPEGQRIAREMVFVIDTSGSMQGTSIVQAKESLQLALARLAPDDRFNIIEFNSIHRTLFAKPVEATAANVQIGKSFVSKLQATGGTNMRPALEAALHGYAPENYLKQVIFVTDGAVGNEAALFSLIEKQLGDARLFTVGIGSAPNSYFMSKSAQFGRGSFTFIGDAREIGTQMSALFHQLESPALSDLDIQWPNSVEQYPRRTPDLYAGSPLLVSAKLSNLNGKVVIKGQTANQNWERSVALPQANKEPSTGVSTLWGRAKIDSLMDEKIRGRNAEEVKAEVLSTALPLRLLSQYTSLVAVEEKIVRNEENQLKTSGVLNAVAKGQVQQPGTYPKTATWMPLNLLAGILSLALWMIARRRGVV